MFECLMKYMFLDHFLDKKRDHREYCDGKCEYSCRILAFLGEWRWKTSRKRSSFDGFQLVFECYPLFMASKFNWNLSAATTTTISIIIRLGHFEEYSSSSSSFLPLTAPFKSAYNQASRSFLLLGESIQIVCVCGTRQNARIQYAQLNSSFEFFVEQ